MRPPRPPSPMKPTRRTRPGRPAGPTDLPTQTIMTAPSRVPHPWPPDPRTNRDRPRGRVLVRRRPDPLRLDRPGAAVAGRLPALPRLPRHRVGTAGAGLGGAVRTDQSGGLPEVGRASGGEGVTLL